MTTLAKMVALAIIYVLTARAGLRLDAVSGFAALVWPPTGIALAALVLGGRRLWPGVFVGAVVANLLTGAPPIVALGIGAGNTFEALLGAYLLRRIRDFDPSLVRLTDALALILVACVSPLASATIGVSTLAVGGVTPMAHFGATWRAWWVGDCIGDLLVAPMLLVWAARFPPRPRLDQLLEAIALGACIVAVSAFVLGRPPGEISPVAHPYILFLPLLWAVLRFGQRGGVATTFAVASAAVWETALRHGPFVQSALHESLLALQIFMGVAAATCLIIGASVSERRRAIEALKEANRVKAEFLAVMSHELRTPLNAIAGYVDLLLSGVRGPLTAEQQRDLGRIHSSEHTLRRLVEDVLSFAKLDAGAVKYHFADVPVDDVLSRLEPLVAPQLGAKGLGFGYNPAGADVKVRADPEKLEQIMLNLLSNAVKYTEAGRVEVACSPGASDVRVSVSDTGIGIAPRMQESIFEPFVQTDRALTRKVDGIGLGLSISRQLARAMDGNITVTSDIGRGSTFTLVLPRAAEPRADISLQR